MSIEDTNSPEEVFSSAADDGAVKVQGAGQRTGYQPADDNLESVARQPDNIGTDDQIEKDKKAKAADGVTSDANQGPYANESFWERYERVNQMKVRDCGDYLSCDTGVGKRPGMTSPRPITDKQIEKILEVAVLKKGWNDLTFYKGSKINQDMTARAQTILHRLQQPGHILDRNVYGDVTVNSTRPAHCPSFLSEAKHERLREKEAKKAAKEDKKVRKKEAKHARRYSNEEGKTAADAMREREAQDQKPSTREEFSQSAEGLPQEPVNQPDPVQPGNNVAAATEETPEKPAVTTTRPAQQQATTASL